MKLKVCKTIIVASLFLIVLSGCDNSSETWQATVYMSQGDKGKMIGEFGSRDECQNAGMMHVSDNKDNAHKKMAKKNMSVNCALVVK